MDASVTGELQLFNPTPLSPPTAPRPAAASQGGPSTRRASHGLVISLLAVLALAACEQSEQPEQAMSGQPTEPPVTTELASPAPDDDDKKCPDAETPLLTKSLQQMPEPKNDLFESRSNCEFHLWSWQMFQWLMQDVDGKPRFLSFETPYSLLGITNREVLLPRGSKDHDPEGFDEFLQAGPDGIFVDLNGNPVYYSQHLSPDFVKFMKKHELLDPAKADAFAADKSFPNGAVELKASWRIVEDGEDTTGVFTRESSVYILEMRDGQIAVSPTQTREVQLALVGFHIGGVVEGHPEMIWATFEHKDNAPSVPPGSTVDTVVSERDFTFYKAGTRLADCNVNSARSGQMELVEETQKLSPVTQVCRLYEFGNSATNSEGISQAGVDQNDANIRMLNKAVGQKLDGQPGPWKNYYEVGAIWFIKSDALRPGMALDTDFDPSNSTDPEDQLLTGSLKLSNATIETFTQVQSTQNNCFRCHNTEAAYPPPVESQKLKPLKAKNINISHAFKNIYFWSQQMAQGKQAPFSEKSSD